jgi:putative aldouronate transport system permease protein
LRSRKSGVDVISFNIIGYIMLSLFALACILPFWMIVVGAITSDSYITAHGYSLVPVEFSTGSFEYIMNDASRIIRAYGVTTLVTAAGTFFGVLINAMAAYVLQRKDFKYRNFFSFYFFFTTLFSGGLVPWYILCVKYLHLKESIFALILPGLVSVWNMLIIKGFLKGISDSISESAHIDGAGDFRIFIQIILPLAKPVIATIALFTSLYYWNDWYNSMLFITNEKLFMLQFYLYKLIGSAQGLQIAADKAGVIIDNPPIQSTKMAMTLIVIGPIIFLYPFVQKYFVKGITIGAVKG